MLYTIEQKVDLALQFIASSDVKEMTVLKHKAAEMLRNGTAQIDQPVSVDDVIIDLLKEVGIPINLSGFRAINAALKLCLADSDYLSAITKQLYPDVASELNTTKTRVERTIRFAIEAGMDRCSYDDIVRVFGNTVHPQRGKLTNSEFLSACTYEIQRRMKMFNN